MQAEPMTSPGAQGPDSDQSSSPGGAGLILFASIMMIMVGVMHAVWGLSAIFTDQFFVVTEEYIFKFDTSLWGWVHLGAGIVVALAGFSLYSGATWARVVGIVLAFVSVVANFATIPYYPFWSILMIALGVLVIWALTVHGDAFSEA